MPSFTPFSTRKLIVGLSLQGWKHKQISQVTDVHQSTVSRIVQHFKSTGDIAHKTILGRAAHEKYSMPEYDPIFLRKEVIRLFEQGCKQVQISQVTGVHTSSVWRIVQHFKLTGEIAHEPKIRRLHEKYTMPKITPISTRKEVIRLFAQGYTNIQISRITGVNKSTVGQIVRRFKSTGDFASIQQRLTIRRFPSNLPQASEGVLVYYE